MSGSHRWQRFALLVLVAGLTGWRMVSLASTSPPTAATKDRRRAAPVHATTDEGVIVPSRGRTVLLVRNPTLRPIEVRLTAIPVPEPAAEATTRSEIEVTGRAVAEHVETSVASSGVLEAGAVPASESRRTFHVHVTDGRLDAEEHYVAVGTRIIRRTRSVRVYLDEQLRESQLAPGLVDEIVSTLEFEAIPGGERLLGARLDVDGDGTLAVVLTPWLDRLQGGRTSVKGFVRPTDFDPRVRPPFGDRADAIFLNATLRPSPTLRAVLAHEFAHVVALSERRRTAETFGTAADEDDWIDEGIAHVTESILTDSDGNLAHRLAAFRAAPHRSPLVVADYYGEGRWRDDGCRGATFSFLKFVVDEHGTDVLQRLVTSTSRGRPNLERATGCSFADLFREWTRVEAGSGHIRTIPWDPESGPFRVTVAGTAAAFVTVETPESGPWRIVAREPNSVELGVVPLDE